ncbi:MAG TPA: M1 family aminopeptidase/hydrolase [Thermoanaerobaculia bacterium]
MPQSPRSRILLALFTFALLVNARQRAVGHPEAWPFSGAPTDVSSFAEPASITTRHLELDLTVDFEARQLRGRATLELENRTNTRTLVLDTYELDIDRVTLDHDTPAQWSLGAPTRIGRPLIISIEPRTRFVSIDYATSTNAAPIPDSIGPILNWTTAAETFGGRAPSVYSLNAPIGARSWMPLQDTPTVRMTYEATLRVPRGMLALMSAVDNPTAATDTGIYIFHMPYRIPSYLIAFAVGRLEFHAFDERTGVYAEPELLDEAAWELQSLPQMMDVAERIAGPFPFARHDVLLMPPTFKVGGMENPMLNFVHPTSAVSGHHPEHPAPKSLIAHELAHSWAGDATTLATWNDVWLNEGFATYLANRILEELRGSELDELAWYDNLQTYTTFLQRANANTTMLHRQVEDPTRGFDSTSYLKGALFLRTLEDRVGRATFDRFLQLYFQRLRWRWVDERTFLSFFRDVVRPDAALEAELRLDEWIYQPGLPSNVTAPISAALRTRAQQRADAFRAGTPIAQLDPGSWSETETTLFLQFASQTVRTRMAEVDAALSLAMRDTPPLSWLVDAINVRYEPGVQAAERVMLRGAPFTWIRTLYVQLARVDRTRAMSIFQSSRGRYYPLLEEDIAAVLGISNLMTKVS